MLIIGESRGRVTVHILMKLTAYDRNATMPYRLKTVSIRDFRSLPAVKSYLKAHEIKMEIDEGAEK